MLNEYCLFTRQAVWLSGLFIVFALSLQSCSTTSKHRSGQLSDAVEEASDKHKGERKVDTEFKPDDEEEDPEHIIDSDDQPAALAADDASVSDLAMTMQKYKANWATLAGGTGLLKEEDFFGLNHFNLAIGTYVGEKHYLELAAGASWAPLQETSQLRESLDGGITLLQIGLGYNYYTTPRHTFMGLYLCAGLGYTYMSWSYKNPFQAMAYDEDGNELGMETISSDGLPGFEMYTGLGLNLIQTEGFHLGAEFLPGLIFWGGETSEGFDNDVFDPFYYTKLKFFLRFGW